MQASREAHQKSSDEAAALHRDNAQLQAALADTRAATTDDVKSRDAQIERLQSDLRQASMAAEVNQAKADVYDELKQHTRQLEAQLREVQASEASQSSVIRELEGMQQTCKVSVLRIRCCSSGF